MFSSTQHSTQVSTGEILPPGFTTNDPNALHHLLNLKVVIFSDQILNLKSM